MVQVHSSPVYARPTYFYIRLYNGGGHQIRMKYNKSPCLSLRPQRCGLATAAVSELRSGDSHGSSDVTALAEEAAAAAVTVLISSR